MESALESFRIDHLTHGRALLSMRVPALRGYLNRTHLEEICESYSLASLYIARLYEQGSSVEEIGEYEDLQRSIEAEIEYYVFGAGRSD